MDNRIDAVRAAIARELATADLCADEGLVESSPCGRFELKMAVYARRERPREPALAVATVRRAVTDQVVATVKRNDPNLFRAWICRADRDYFLFPEDLEGQTVVDLKSGRVEGYSSEADPFIWAELHGSPDGARLAVVGCYWACPFELVVYDFRKPLSLPLPVLLRFDLPGNDARFEGWVAATVVRLVDAGGKVHDLDVTQGADLQSPEDLA